MKLTLLSLFTILIALFSSCSVAKRTYYYAEMNSDTTDSWKFNANSHYIKADSTFNSKNEDSTSIGIYANIDNYRDSDSTTIYLLVSNPTYAEFFYIDYKNRVSA